MEYTLLILLLLIMIWINLRNKISKSQEKTEELSKEIAALRRRLENSSEVADEIKEPEPEILKEPEVFVQPEPVKAIVEPARNLQPRKVRKPVNYEKYIGENLFGKIGILILVLGMDKRDLAYDPWLWDGRITSIRGLAFEGFLSYF